MLLSRLLVQGTSKEVKPKPMAKVLHEAATTASRTWSCTSKMATFASKYNDACIPVVEWRNTLVDTTKQVVTLLKAQLP